MFPNGHHLPGHSWVWVNQNRKKYMLNNMNKRQYVSFFFHIWSYHSEMHEVTFYVRWIILALMGFYSLNFLISYSNMARLISGLRWTFCSVSQADMLVTSPPCLECQIQWIFKCPVGSFVCSARKKCSLGGGGGFVQKALRNTWYMHWKYLIKYKNKSTSFLYCWDIKLLDPLVLVLANESYSSSERQLELNLRPTRTNQHSPYESQGQHQIFNTLDVQSSLVCSL